MAPPILVCSSSFSLRAGLITYLSFSHQVNLASSVRSAAEALEAIARQAPALLIIDTSGQNEEALGLLEQVKQQWPEVRCLFLAESPALAERGQAAGADAALVWGFPSDQLTAQIRRLTARPDVPASPLCSPQPMGQKD
jgi:DNA-binding NarL/FixJ family response regulator